MDSSQSEMKQTNNGNQRKWVFMDAGDTFIYGYPTFYDAIRDCFRAIGQDIEIDRVKHELFRFLKEHSRDKITSQDIFTEYFHSLYRTVLLGLSFSGDLDHYVDYLWKEWESGHRLRLFDDARTALCRLVEAGFSLAVISNWDETLDKLLQRLEVDQFFEYTVISCRIGIAKPDRRIFEAALERAGTTSDQSWYLGDQIDADILPAKSLGMRTIWVDYYGKGEAKNTKNDYASSMSEAVRIILETNQ